MWLLAVGASLLLAACGNSPSTGVASLGGTTTTIAHSSKAGGPSTSSDFAGRLAFSQCVRRHGVPNFPDPNGQGKFVVSGSVGVSRAVIQAATRTCSQYLPTSGRGPATAQINQLQADQLRFARCMRVHGFIHFPDPIVAADGSVNFPIQSVGEIDPNSPTFQRTQRICQEATPNFKASSG
jgi:hypothetical protein